jgi:hypothetical protein
MQVMAEPVSVHNRHRDRILGFRSKPRPTVDTWQRHRNRHQHLTAETDTEYRRFTSVFHRKPSVFTDFRCRFSKFEKTDTDGWADLNCRCKPTPTVVNESVNRRSRFCNRLSQRGFRRSEYSYRIEPGTSESRYNVLQCFKNWFTMFYHVLQCYKDWLMWQCRWRNPRTCVPWRTRCSSSQCFTTI